MEVSYPKTIQSLCWTLRRNNFQKLLPSYAKKPVACCCGRILWVRSLVPIMIVTKRKTYPVISQDIAKWHQIFEFQFSFCRLMVSEVLRALSNHLRWVGWFRSFIFLIYRWVSKTILLWLYLVSFAFLNEALFFLWNLPPFKGTNIWIFLNLNCFYFFIFFLRKPYCKICSSQPRNLQIFLQIGVKKVNKMKPPPGQVCVVDIIIPTNSTAQGGGGNFNTGNL